VLNRLDLHSIPTENYLVELFQRDLRLSERDRAFTVHLIQGVLRWRLRLDWIIEKTASFPFRKIENPVLNVLRLALYQIFFMDRVPDSAAVNEAVKQVKTIAENHVVRSVNGILRQVCRDKEQVVFPPREAGLARYLSVRHSFPEWLVRKWLKEVGPGTTEGLLEASNLVPRLVVRTNTLKIRRHALIRYLEGEGLSAGPAHYAPDGVILEGNRGPVDRIPGFQSGLFQVQGEMAQVCSQLLSPRPGEEILDLCSGVGGKSTHMAQMMENSGRILALDRSPGKLIKLAENSRRLGIRTIESVVGDASEDLANMVRMRFDRIMVDGPCSALGIISRHPDVKWNRDENDIFRLSSLQMKILSGSVPLLVEGGRMLYVTCTLSRTENEGVVEGFLREQREMKLIDLRADSPEWCSELLDDSGFLKSYPHVHGTEGFFGALFEKQGLD
jgi:16S rRNA (cytosine967-C5)-methyltransferase